MQIEMNPNEYLEINKMIYDLMKENDPKNYHCYTARIQFRYYKLIKKKEIVAMDFAKNRY